MSDIVRLHVCVSCRDEAGAPAGLALHDALVGAIPATDGVTLIAVECLSNCQRGCAAAISSDSKWGYLLGGLSAALAMEIADYARRYAAATTGTVMPSRRAASLAGMICGRIPGSAMTVPRPRELAATGRAAGAPAPDVGLGGADARDAA